MNIGGVGSFGGLGNFRTSQINGIPRRGKNDLDFSMNGLYPSWEEKVLMAYRYQREKAATEASKNH